MRRAQKGAKLLISIVETKSFTPFIMSHISLTRDTVCYKARKREPHAYGRGARSITP